jgi:hypothetical protein
LYEFTRVFFLVLVLHSLFLTLMNHVV